METVQSSTVPLAGQAHARSATRATIVLTVIAAAVSSLTVLGAPPKILVVNVQDWRGRPKPGVTIAPAGSGSVALTDDAGRGQIRLPDATEPGSFVTLRVVRPEDLRVVAPPRGRTPVPKFDGSSDSYVDVILMTYADAAALESPTVLADLVARSVAPPAREASPPARQAAPPQPRSPAPPQRGRPGASIFGGHMVLASLIQQQPGGSVSASGVTPLVTDSAARELGFTRAQVDRALAQVTSDPLTWKAVLLTAEIEAGGRDPFGIALGNPGAGDIEFGIGFWSLRGETLQPVLKRMREADVEHFDRIMGDDRQAVIQWLDMSRDDASAFVRQRMLDRSVFRVAEPWKSRFRALGAETAFQRVQMREMERLWVNRTRRVLPQLDLRSERAFAFVYDAMIQQGLSALTSLRVNAAFDGFEREIGRKPDEQEKLLLLANVASERTPVQLRNIVRERRLAFALGEGRVYGRRVNLLNAGFGMRDIGTGALVPLVNDRAVLQRLTDGWRP